MLAEEESREMKENLAREYFDMEILNPESTEARCDSAVTGQNGTGCTTGRADFG